MTNKDLTELVLIVDRSGSMSKISSDAEGGLNAFLEEQRENTPGKVQVTLVEFDHEINTLHDGADIEDVKPYKLVPRGTTALLDAVGFTINKVGERLANTREEERPGRVIVVVVTDGLENSSKEFKKKDLLDKIEHQKEKYSWEFVYLGANQDAFAEGSSLGFNASANYVATSNGVRSMYASLSSSITDAVISGKNVQVTDTADVE